MDGTATDREPPIDETFVRAWAKQASADPLFSFACRGLSFLLSLHVGAETFHLQIREGSLSWQEERRGDERQRLVLAAPEKVWRRLLSPDPPPGYQGLGALRKHSKDFQCEGDPLLVAQALAALERFLEIGRALSAGPVASQARVAHGSAPRDPALICGRYVDLAGPDSRMHRVYYEEAGSGSPLLFLHTAGADSRQYHEFLTDVEIASEWHMFAFDLPHHGRSTPSGNWWMQPYRLAARDYAHWCLTFIDRVIGEAPVVVGCSMGAAMAIYLAVRHSAHIRAVVAVEAPARAPGRRSPYLTHAAVNQALHNPAYVFSLMSPSSPPEGRMRAWWYYSQAAYGVYEGDLWFYSEEWDVRDLLGDTPRARIPVYLLTGEYDYSASPESTMELSRHLGVPADRVRILPGLGHFPMVEDPDRFRPYLMEVLRELKQSTVTRASVSGSVMSPQQE